MDKFIIRGGKKLKGAVAVSGAKNAALALIPSTLLASGKYRFDNVPELRDVVTMKKLLQTMGGEIGRDGHTLKVNTFRVNKFEAPHEHVNINGRVHLCFGAARIAIRLRESFDARRMCVGAPDRLICTSTSVLR